jgi:ribose/xylose/arabinose/galactoside ABC-type transport system permease subunit
LLPFVVTLGMMGALRGTAKRVAGDETIYPDETWLNGLMRLGRHGGVPAGVWLMFGLAVLVALMLRYTRFGRHVFAVGSNEQTARLCGVPVERVKLLVYALGAGFAGVAAVLQFAYLTGGDPTTAGGYELNIIAAVVIGGASLAGGQGTVAGTLVGALIMTVVANGCTKLGLANSVQEIVTGAIIIAAVLLDYVRRRDSQK